MKKLHARPLPLCRLIAHITLGLLALGLLALCTQPVLNPLAILFNIPTLSFWIASFSWLLSAPLIILQPRTHLHTLWPQFILLPTLLSAIAYTPVINWTIQTFRPSFAAHPLSSAPPLDLSLLDINDTAENPTQTLTRLSLWASQHHYTLLTHPTLQKTYTPLKSNNSYFYETTSYITLALHKNGSLKTITTDARPHQPLSPSIIDTPTTALPLPFSLLPTTLSLSAASWLRLPDAQPISSTPSLSGGYCLKSKNNDSAPCSPFQTFWTQTTWTHRPFAHVWNARATPSSIITTNPLTLFSLQHPSDPFWIINKIPIQSAISDITTALKLSNHHHISATPIHSLFVSNLHTALSTTRHQQQLASHTANILVYGETFEYPSRCSDPSPSQNTTPDPTPCNPPSPTPPQEALLHIIHIKTHLLNQTFALNASTGAWYALKNSQATP